jgi:DNA-binding CsgD family transcriptional regulator|tara:strand:- start:827 stop:1309 length:483 start_codon:yes stop_codon:yes gene_type:complete
VGYRKYFPAIVLSLAMAFFIFDIIGDLISGKDGFFHITMELIVFIAISAVLYFEIKHVKYLGKEIIIEKSKTARLAGEMLSIIRQQFLQWKLTQSESEVALLLIKGLSMKEVALVRNVKEKTVRSQATSIYSKSGYSGRHELAAHFIEDLMSEFDYSSEK